MENIFELTDLSFFHCEVVFDVRFWLEEELLRKI